MVRQRTGGNGFILRLLARVALAMASIWPLSSAAQEQEQAPWLQLIAACETVIDTQKADAFRALPTAPFNAGLPHYREYGYYDESQALVMIAAKWRDVWQSCTIREAVEDDRERFRHLAEIWSTTVEHAFPGTDYRHGTFRYNPERPYPVAVRCRENENPIVIAPKLASMMFQVDVYVGPKRLGDNVCATG